MKTLLITRPAEDASPLKEQLATRGFATLCEPLLTIRSLPDSKSKLDDLLSRTPQALLITSRNALRVFANFTALRTIPLFCVGEATAALARSLGFTVSAVAETAEALKELAAKHTNAATPLLYLRGEDIRFDFAGALKGKGFRVDSVTLYRADAATEFSASLLKAMLEERLAGGLFFSARTAETYSRLAHHHGLTAAHRALSAVCMSTAIAEALGPLPWHGIHIAEKPDREHMLKASEDAF